MATLLSPPRHYLNDGYVIKSWLLTRDHKRIALLYLAGVTFFFFIGGGLAVPKLNLLSWYIYILGGLFTVYALVTGGVDTGWTFYTPFSTVSSTTNVIPTALGIF